MENFERLVREKIRDENKAKIVIDYFYKETVGKKESTLISSFNDIAEFDDIFNEFIEVLESGSYNKWNPIMVGPYNAYTISKIDSNLNVYAVYCFLIGLRKKDEKMRNLLDSLIVLKLNEEDWNEQ